MLRQIAAKDFGVVPGQQDARRAAGDNHRFFGRRIEGFEVGQADLRQLRRHGHIHIAVYGHSPKVGVVGDVGQVHRKAHGVSHDVFHRLQFGHIVARFIGHRQISVGRVQPRFLIAVHGAHDRSLAPVISRQRQMPVAKHAIELLQIVQRRAGRCLHIAPVVVKSVLLEREVFARCGHELPHASGFDAGIGLRVKGALNKGQQRQFGGHMAAL